MPNPFKALRNAIRGKKSTPIVSPLRRATIVPFEEPLPPVPESSYANPKPPTPPAPARQRYFATNEGASTSRQPGLSQSTSNLQASQPQAPQPAAMYPGRAHQYRSEGDLIAARQHQATIIPNYYKMIMDSYSPPLPGTTMAKLNQKAVKFLHVRRCLIKYGMPNSKIDQIIGYPPKDFSRAVHRWMEAKKSPTSTARYLRIEEKRYQKARAAAEAARLEEERRKEEAVRTYQRERYWHAATVIWAAGRLPSTPSNRMIRGKEVVSSIKQNNPKSELGCKVFSLIPVSEWSISELNCQASIIQNYLELFIQNYATYHKVLYRGQPRIEPGTTRYKPGRFMSASSSINTGGHFANKCGGTVYRMEGYAASIPNVFFGSGGDESEFLFSRDAEFSVHKMADGKILLKQIGGMPKYLREQERKEMEEVSDV